MAKPPSGKRIKHNSKEDQSGQEICFTIVGQYNIAESLKQSFTIILQLNIMLSDVDVIIQI